MFDTCCRTLSSCRNPRDLCAITDEYISVIQTFFCSYLLTHVHGNMKPSCIVQLITKLTKNYTCLHLDKELVNSTVIQWRHTILVNTSLKDNTHARRNVQYNLCKLHVLLSLRRWSVTTAVQVLWHDVIPMWSNSPSTVWLCWQWSWTLVSEGKWHVFVTALCSISV